MLPKRAYHREVLKTQALEVASITKKSPLFIYKETPLHDGTIFYISAEKNEILKTSYTLVPGAYYLMFKEELEANHLEPIYKLNTLYVNEDIYLAKVNF